MRRSVFLTAVLVASMPWLFFAGQVEAATLSDATDTLSNQSVASTSSHTVGFDLSDGSAMQIEEIDFQFATTDTGNTKPSGLSLGSATLGSLSGNLGGGWSIDTSGSTGGLLRIVNTSPVSLGTSATLSVEFNAITNQTDINLCDVSNGTLTDTCYVNITAFSDLGSTSIGTGSAPYVVTEDPSMDFEILPVSAGVTTNGFTTDLASTGTDINFGNLSADQVHYVAQQLYIKTNAPHGYTVYAYVADTLNGVATDVNVSPFGATNATWTTPQLWMGPTGASAGSNSGWFAANTNDHRVTGWTGTTTSKLGPLSATKRAVAYSSGPDSGTTVTVTYALGVSIYQPSDLYQGTIRYDVEATY